MRSIAISIWIYFLGMIPFLISCGEQENVIKNVDPEAVNPHAKSFLQQIQRENAYDYFLELMQGNKPLYEFIQLSTSSKYGLYYFIPYLGNEHRVEGCVYYPASILDRYTAFTPFILTPSKLNEEIPITERFLYSAKFKCLQEQGLDVDSKLIEFAELLADTIISISPYDDVVLPKSTRSGGSLSLSIGYDATYIGTKIDAVYGLSLSTFAGIASREVGRYFPNMAMTQALSNPVMMLGPVGNVFSVEDALREIARNIEIEMLRLDFNVYVQYSYSVSGVSFGGGASAGTGGGSSGGGSSSGGVGGGNKSDALPDTCKNINEVKDFLVRLLHEKNVIINSENIIESICGCRCNAQKKDGKIEICQNFYQWELKDQYSILWHEIYHLRNDVPIIGKYQLLQEVIQLTPNSLIRGYLNQIALKEIEGLILPNTVKAQIIQSRMQDCLQVEYIYPPDYYKNEMNTYKAEIETNTDVSEYYAVTREFQYWLDQELYKISQKYYNQ